MIPTQIAVREELVEQGLLRTDRTDDGVLAIYTYTDRCVQEKAWNEITLNSRGHDQQWDRLRGIIMDSIYPKGNQYAEVRE